MIQRIRLVVFLIASLVILTVVSGKMLLAERAVRLGEEFRFPVQGYDPHDPFRGRYLALSMENRARVRKGEPAPGAGEIVCVSIVRRSDGSAGFGEISRNPPGDGSAWLSVNCSHRVWDSEVTREWSFVPPFERFYLNEKLAPEAERRLNRALADSDSRVELVLKVYRGFACIVDLTINGVPIRELSKSAGKDVKS